MRINYRLSKMCEYIDVLEKISRKVGAKIPTDDEVINNHIADIETFEHTYQKLLFKRLADRLTDIFAVDCCYDVKGNMSWFSVDTEELSNCEAYNKIVGGLMCID